MYRRTTLPVVVSVFLGAGALANPGLAQDDSNALFPNTRDHGSAVVEHEDDALQAVVAYNYSQRHHDSRWLLIQLAMTASSHMRIDREDIFLRDPDGREIPLPPHEVYRQDRRRVVTLRQNSSLMRHDILSYINRPAESSPFRFLVEPGHGIRDRFFEVDRWRVAWGDLYFASPTDAWDAGTYSLVINGEDGTQAVLPIKLH